MPKKEGPRTSSTSRPAIALRASGGWLEDQSLRTVQVAGQLQHALLAARLGHDLDAGSQTEEYGQGVDVLRLQARALASGGFLEGGQIWSG